MESPLSSELSVRSAPCVALKPDTSAFQSVTRFEMRSWEWSGPLPLFLPLPVVRECGLSAQRSVDGLAHEGPTSPQRRSFRIDSGTSTSTICSTIHSGTHSWHRNVGVALHGALLDLFLWNGSEGPSGNKRELRLRTTALQV